MAKAPKEHVDRLRTWLQFTDELLLLLLVKVVLNFFD